MRTSLLLVLPLSVACVPIPGKDGGDDQKKTRTASSSDDCDDDTLSTADDDDCSESTALSTLRPTVRRTFRPVTSIGSTDPGRSRGEGPIPMAFLTSGAQTTLAAGIPVASAVVLFDQNTLTGGADDLASTVLVDSPDAEFGAAVADAGTPLVDGEAAFLVGAPGLDSVFLFPVSVPSTEEARYAAAATFTGAEASGAGHTLAVGDFDGDGQADLAIGATGLGDHGGVYLHLGLGPDGTDLTTAPQLLGTEDAALDGPMTNLGDLDGDGADELGIGSPSQGRVSVFWGGGAWTTDGASAEAAHTTLTGTGSDSLGTALAAVGDADGDGVADVVVGAPDDSTRIESAGAVYMLSAETLLEGGVHDAAEAATQVWYGESESGGTGAALAGSGDTNEDGLPEPLVGSPWASDLEGTSQTGAIHLVQDTGRSGYIGRPAHTYTGDEGDLLGVSLAAGADIDGDGVDDMAAVTGGRDEIEVLLSGG